MRGRAAELSTLARTVGHGDGGRLALVGPGGSGKSMLAAALAHRVAARFPGGIHWFRIGAWDSRTMFEMLALRFGTRRERKQLVPGLRAHLRRRGRTLVVLDNHEDDRATAEVLDALKDYTAFTSRNGFHLNGDQSGRGLSSFTYRPFTLEGNFIAMDAVHEMLLQYESKDVHVFPSVPTAWADVSFERLRAAGGWVVSARRVGGRTVEVEITSEHGGELRVANPFGDRAVRWEGATMTYAPIGGNTIRRTNGTWRGVLPPGGRVRGRVR
jgi:hypothetical protein